MTVSSIGSHSEFTARAESVTGLKSSSDKKQSAPIGLHPGAELGSRLEGDGVCMQELIDVVARLRAPGGCPWDAEQTHESLVQYLIEETYELVDAIESQDRDAMLEELGDVLYQVLFHADIAAHATDHPFTIDDVARAMTTKMVGRHEHVFGDGVAQTAADVVALWDDVKAREKPHRMSVLDGIPLAMPSLALADKIIGRAQKLGMVIGGEECEAATVSYKTVACEDVSSEDELGSLLLALVVSAKAQGFDAERALRSTLRDFQNQIRQTEAAISGADMVG